MATMKISTVNVFDASSADIKVTLLDTKLYQITLAVGGIRFFFATQSEFLDFVDTLRFAATALTDPKESFENDFRSGSQSFVVN